MGIKKNVLYASLLTASNYIFPLLVYPYVARVLGVANIGLCNFIDSVINYFILFSMMGMTIMGNRQMASDRARNIPLDNSFSNLFTLNAISTLVALGLLTACTLTIPELRANQKLMWFGAVKVLSNFFLIEWFYKGIEDFKYITLRTIFVKSLYVVSIFLLVRNSEDYYLYYLLTVLMVTGNALINTVHSGKFVHLRFKHIKLKGLVKPFFLLGVYMLVTSLCTSFNVVYLGFMTDDTQVGYYTTATKLYSIFLAFFTGLTSVMLPRMSNLVSLNKHDEFKELLSKTTLLLFSFSLPVIIFSVIFSPQIVTLLAGPGYDGAVLPMRIVMPLMLIIGYEQIVVIQGLMPLHRDKNIMINACCGAAVSLLLNLLLVHKLLSVGSAISWISSEFTIMVLSQIVIFKYMKISFPFIQLGKQIIFNIPLALGLVFLYFGKENFSTWAILLLGGGIMCFYTGILQLFIIKNPLLLPLVNKLKLKF